MLIERLALRGIVADGDVLSGENESLGAVVEGRLNLCDLAGSERLSRSQATGDRLKETQAINKSLSCLTDVFVALANKNAHVCLPVVRHVQPLDLPVSSHPFLLVS